MELQESKRINLAIISPNKKSYSETFIDVQRDHLPHNIFHYYNGIPPTKLGNDINLKPGLLQTVCAKLIRSKRNLLANNIKKSLRKNRIDVVLAQFGPTGAAIAAICEELRLPLVAHFHGADAYVHRYINPIEPYQKLFKKAAAMIVVSDDMKEQLLRLGAPENKIVQTCYGPREDFFNLNSLYDKKRLLAVGRFVDKKAPYFTVLAFAQLLTSHPDAVLTMAGDGPLLGVCKNLVRYLKIENKVRFEGALSHSEICRLMQDSLCFVQHSITAEDGDKEGSPVAIIEAGAAGLAVIATKHTGINLTVIHGKTGYLVDERDVDGMAQYMKKICDDFSLAKQLGDNGRKHIRQNATLEKYINDINNVILNCL